MNSFHVLLIAVSMFKYCTVSACSCNGDLNDQSLGECNSRFRDKEWCYVDPGECSDETNSKSSNRVWSYKACVGAVQCYTENNKKCQFPFRYKGKTFFECTYFDSENSRSWCATEVTGPDRTAVRGSYVDCAEWSSIQNRTGLDIQSMEAKYGDDCSYSSVCGGPPCIKTFDEQCMNVTKTVFDENDKEITIVEQRCCSGCSSPTKTSGGSSQSSSNSGSTGWCPRYTCRRGRRCCKVVYKGRNRGYGCPRWC